MSRQYFVAGQITPVYVNDIDASAAIGIPGAYVDETSPASVSASPSVTGVSATGSVGSVTPNVKGVVSGVAATGSVGTIGHGANKTLAGIAGTGAAGAIVASASLPMAGVSCTASAGSVSVSVANVTNFSVSGAEGVGDVGELFTAVIENSGADRQYFIVSDFGVIYFSDDSQKEFSLTGVYLDNSSLLETTISIDPGVHATGSPGTIFDEIDIAISGVSATGSTSSIAFAQFGVVGTATPGIVYGGPAGTLTVGVSATASVGSIAATSTKTESLPSVSCVGFPGQIIGAPQFSGVQAAVSVGNIIAGLPVIAGVAATAAVNDIASDVEPFIVGVSATVSIGDINDTASVALPSSSGVALPGNIFDEVDAFAISDAMLGQVGNVIVTSTHIELSSVGVAATGYAQDISGSTPSVDGVAATVSVGDVGQGTEFVVAGIEAAGSVGLIYASAVLPYGVQAVALVGDITPQIIQFQLPVTITGVEGAASVGSVIANVVRSVAGVAAVGSVGSLAEKIDNALAGVAGVAAVAAIVSDVIESALGVQATGSVGSVGFSTTGSALGGIVGTGQAGIVSTIYTGNLSLVGSSATGAVGALGLHEITSPSIVGISSSASVGSISPEMITATPSGVHATGSVQAIGVTSTMPVQTGAQASALPGNVIYVDFGIANGVSASATVGDLSATIIQFPFGAQALGQVGDISVQNLVIGGVAGNSFVGVLGVVSSGSIEGVDMLGYAGDIIGLMIQQTPSHIALDDFSISRITLFESVPVDFWMAA